MTNEPKRKVSPRTSSRNKEDEILIKAAKAASSKAIRTSKALGLTIQVIEGNQIISIGPDDRRKVVGTIKKSVRDLPSLKKGVKLIKREA